MKHLICACIMLFFYCELPAQSHAFGLLKFNIPSGWQEQSKQAVVAYSGRENETNTQLVIKVFQELPAGAKPDSSFKMQWQNIMSSAGNPPVPYARKRYASSGIQIAINQANPAEITDDNQQKYTQLLVFIVGKQMQAVQFITDNLADFKTLRPFIDDFIETTDTIAKRD